MNHFLIKNVKSILSNFFKRYTNHSLRVTSMQVLEDGNVETRHIIRVSGHKSAESVSNYARRLSAAKKRNLSSILSDSLGNSSNRQHFPAVQGIQNFTSLNDDVDEAIRNIPSNFFGPQAPSHFNVVPGSFTPMISNCSNITFNVYTNSHGANCGL